MKKLSYLLTWSVLALSVIGLLLVADFADACPTCKDGISENSTEQSQIVQGYFWSILFMMGMPFVILGTLSSCLYVTVLRERKRQAIAKIEGVDFE